MTAPLPLGFLSALCLLALAACGTPALRSPPETAPSLAPNPQLFLDSSMELTSILNRRAHRFFARSTAQGVVAQSYADKQLLKEATLDRARYAELATRVQAMIDAPRRQIANAPSCRSPFSITLRLGEQVRTLTGCRSPEETSGLSRILRDAEFLLYSQK